MVFIAAGVAGVTGAAGAQRLDAAIDRQALVARHGPQRGDLPVDLPANGALLAAVAMMAGGWDGDGAPVAGAGGAPGFSQDGTWRVRAEGFGRLP